MSRRFVLFTIALLALTAGCNSRLSFSTTKTVKPGDIIPFECDGPKSEQKVTVEFTADNEVNVHVCLEKDRDAVDAALTSIAKKMPDILGSKDKATSGSIQVTVPAKTKFVVFITAPTKTAEVKLKVTG